MIKQIYIHNYQCLVNFKIAFDVQQTTSLLLGANGSGKTSLFSALHEIQRFISYGTRLDDKHNPTFGSKSLTRWLNENSQRFEIDIKGEEGVYKYCLEIEHDAGTHQKRSRVKEEKLFIDSQPLYDFKIIDGIGTAKLYNDNISRPPVELHSIGWNGSGLTDIYERPENRKLTNFKKWFEKLFIVQIIPSSIASYFEEEDSHPEKDMSNFPAWLSYWNNENREGIAQVEENLREILNGFSTFKFTKSGIAKTLDLKLKEQYVLNFSELSDGQKVLAVLYTLVYCVPEYSTVFIDEPDNFLALSEIQTWLDALRDHYLLTNSQALLISHHPSLINFLAPNSGYWFSRENNHSRVERIKHEDGEGLTLAELIEQGWAYGA